MYFAPFRFIDYSRPLSPHTLYIVHTQALYMQQRQRVPYTDGAIVSSTLLCATNVENILFICRITTRAANTHWRLSVCAIISILCLAVQSLYA